MALLIAFIFLSSWTAAALTLPYSSYVKGSRVDFESSGSGPEEPVRGIVKVVQLDHHTLTQSGFFRRGLTPRRAPSHSTRLPFPSFLSRGRPGQAVGNKAPVNPLHNLRPKNPTELELKKKQGLQMWQKVIDKGGKMSLPVNLKDMKQTCTAVPFTQVRAKESYVFSSLPINMHMQIRFRLTDFLHDYTEYWKFLTVSHISVDFKKKKIITVCISCGVEALIFTFSEVKETFMSMAAVFTLNLTLAVIFPACDSRWMRNSDSTQQAVFRPMQLPLCPVWRRVWRTESWDRSLPPAGPLLPLCTIKSSDCYCASALWSRRPGEASDGGGRVQVWDRPWRKERHGCRFQARVTL